MKLTLFALFAALALSSCVTTGTAGTGNTGNPKADAIQCAKDAGKAMLADVPALFAKAATQDWTGALAEILKTAGPGVLCEIDVLVELLAGKPSDAQLAGMVGAFDGAMLGQQGVTRADIGARLKAFRELHRAEAVPAAAPVGK